MEAPRLGLLRHGARSTTKADAVASISVAVMPCVFPRPLGRWLSLSPGTTRGADTASRAPSCAQNPLRVSLLNLSTRCMLEQV